MGRKRARYGVTEKEEESLGYNASIFSDLTGPEGKEKTCPK